jgi:hypothetical protein
MPDIESQRESKDIWDSAENDDVHIYIIALYGEVSGVS